MTNLFHQILRTHQWIYKNTNGLLGHRLLFGNPTLLLHTTGRKTGLPRITALTYARDGDAYLVVASKGGAPTPPAWLANLKADPDCEIQIGRRQHRVTARPTLPDDPDYARRWTIVNAVNKDRYTEYHDKTDRPIAIVELHRAGRGTRPTGSRPASRRRLHQACHSIVLSGLMSRHHQLLVICRVASVTKRWDVRA